MENHLAGGGVNADEENSYMEPSYDEVDQSSDSYEPTYYHESKPIKDLLAPESSKPSQSDDDADYDQYECTHD